MKRTFIQVTCLVVMLVSPSNAAATVIERVSVDGVGNQSNGESRLPAGNFEVSAHGRYVVFESDASNLVPDDLNGWSDIFIRDRMLGTTTRVSVNIHGLDASAPSEFPSISVDGRYVAFRSAAYDLVDDDFNWEWDIFVRDLALGVTVRASVSADGGDAESDSFSPSISADGRYVAFLSRARDLIPGGANRQNNVFVRDMLMGETELATVSWDGGGADAGSWAPRISGDGRHVAFVSGANNLVQDDGNVAADVFVRDLDLDVTTRVSVNQAGGDCNGGSGGPSISAAGDHVAFHSTASDLVDDDTNGQPDIFVRVLAGDPYTHRVNLTSQGEQAVDFGSWRAQISAGARYVSFLSDADNLVPDDNNGFGDVFTHDRWTGVTTRVSVDLFGNQGDDWSGNPSLSQDGRFVVFESVANNLVAGDTGWRDVFIAQGPAVLFVDGFESGDTSEWSASVP